MNAPLGIALETSSPTALAALASLPVSFRRDDSSSIRVIAGTAGWTGRLAESIGQGARAVIVDSPEPDDPEQLRTTCDAARDRQVAVRLAGIWASPAVTAFAEAPNDSSGPTVLVQVTGSRRDGAPLRLLVDQLQVMRYALGTVELDEPATAGEVFAVPARLRGTSVPVLFSGAITSAGLLRIGLRELRATGRRSLDLGDETTASPGVVRIADPGGDRELPSIYEIGARTAWRRLHQDATTGASDLSELVAYAEDAATAAGCLSGSAGGAA